MVLKVSHGMLRKAWTHMVKADAEIMCISQKNLEGIPSHFCSLRMFKELH